MAIVGSEGPLGRRVVALLEARDDVELVPGGTRSAGAAVVVVLATDPSAVRPVLASAEATAVVAVSSAMVYGAWPTNPVPLTEEAPVRPNPGVAQAAAAAEVERLVAVWVGGAEGRSGAVLRPAVVVDDDHEGEVSEALRRLDRTGDADPARQFLHLDDLAAAVVTAAVGRLDGPYNVAARGWVGADEVRALAGTPRVRLPGRRDPAAEALRPYAVHPWVVAVDRLEAAGWAPTSTSEEAFVAAHRGTPWTRLSPRRRQELLLAAAGATLFALAASATALVLRSRRAQRNMLR